jgi:hypothetical protein
MQVFYFIRVGVKKLHKKMCMHRYSFRKTVLLIGRRYAEYECTKCGKIGHMRYDHEYEIEHVG